MDRKHACRWVEVSFQHEVVRDKIAIGASEEDMRRQSLTIAVRVTVTHVDREIGLVELRKAARDLLDDEPYDIGERSLEGICEEMMDALVALYPRRAWQIRILENGTNGALLEYEDFGTG